MPGDNRKSFRILTPAGRERATLRLGKKQVAVRLVDESAGGYAVACVGDVKAAMGDVLELRTPGGLHEVKVIRREQFSDGVLIGLARVRDLDDPQQPQVKSSWLDYVWLPEASGGPGGGSGGLRWGWAIGFVLIGAMLMALGNFLATYRPPRVQANVLPIADEVVDQFTDKARRAAAQRQAEIEAAKLGMNRPSSGTSGGLSRSWRSAPGKIAGALGLSAEQRRQIDAIVGQSPAASKNPADKDAQIRGVLTAQQAEQWRRMQP